MNGPEDGAENRERERERDRPKKSRKEKHRKEIGRGVTFQNKPRKKKSS